MLIGLFRGTATSSKFGTVLTEYPFLAFAMVRSSSLLQELEQDAQKLLALTHGLVDQEGDQLVVTKKSTLKRTSH